MNSVLSRREGKCAIVGARRCNCRGCPGSEQEEKPRELSRGVGRAPQGGRTQGLSFFSPSL